MQSSHVRKRLIDEYSSTAYGLFGGSQVNVVMRKKIKACFEFGIPFFEVTLINLNLMTLPRH